MEKSSAFCTCSSTDCPLHPGSHDKGCSPCVAKSLRNREIPSCFFQAAEGTDKRGSYKFEDFAQAVLSAGKDRRDAPRAPVAAKTPGEA